MCRIPEQRYSLFENEAVLNVPVYLFSQGLLDIERAAEEACQRAACLSDVDVGNLVECHENRRKQGVHQHADAQRHEELAPGERCPCQRVTIKPFGSLAVEVESVVKQDHCSRLENGHGGGDDDTENAPNEHLRHQSEAFFHVNAFLDSQRKHLAEGAEDGKLEEAHQQAVMLRRTDKPVPGSRDKSEAADDRGYRYDCDII